MRVLVSALFFVFQPICCNLLGFVIIDNSEVHNIEEGGREERRGGTKELLSRNILDLSSAACDKFIHF